jgi:hypothetical protein
VEAQIPGDWDGPFVGWSGANTFQGLECPHNGDHAYDGTRDWAPLQCEPCTCGPSTGACTLPSKLTASTDICSGAGQPLSFDAPASWNGTCDMMNPVGPGLAKSLTIAPLTVKLEWCPVLPAPPKRALTLVWQTLAIGCHEDKTLHCKEPGYVCLPKPDPTWHICVMRFGDVDCPADNEGFWPRRTVFYKGAVDGRKCTDCSCGPPQGSMCTAHFQAYTDGACSTPVDPGYTITSVSQKCDDIQPPGAPLGSKSATTPTYTPGTCDPIPGVPDEGPGVQTKDPFTVCCKP